MSTKNIKEENTKIDKVKEEFENRCKKCGRKLTERELYYCEACCWLCYPLRFTLYDFDETNQNSNEQK